MAVLTKAVWTTGTMACPAKDLFDTLLQRLIKIILLFQCGFGYGVSEESENYFVIRT